MAITDLQAVVAPPSGPDANAFPADALAARIEVSEFPRKFPHAGATFGRYELPVVQPVRTLATPKTKRGVGGRAD